jgi:CMP-N-acetylneuraminic acid synthetase
MSKSNGKVVALLPMKANSERVRGKNFKEFCGKPLFRWILDTLLEVDEIDQIIINTDARQILAENGLNDTTRITIRDRKPEICGDLVSMNKVLARGHISDDPYDEPVDERRHYPQGSCGIQRVPGS